MKLFRYQNFIKESKENIDSICKKYNIQNYTINDDLSIDVDANVDLYSFRLSKLPLKFAKVSGHFYCNTNQLKTLSGSPLSVGSDFYCYINQLTSLEGSPLSVGGNFYCNDNQLLSLEGSPISVGGNFSCFGNKLTSLSGISQRISGNIDCRYNELRDVKGIKDGWSGRISILGNPVFEIFKLFPYKRWDEVIEYLNEYEVIRDGKVVVLQALEQVYWEMGLEVPEIEEIEGYEIQY
jgi:hypothetical protein